MHSVILLPIRAFYEHYGRLIEDFLHQHHYPSHYHDWVFTWIVDECLLRADSNVRFIIGQHQCDYDGIGKAVLADIPVGVYLMRELLESAGITFNTDIPVKTAVTYDSLILMKCWSHYEIPKHSRLAETRSYVNT